MWLPSCRGQSLIKLSSAVQCYAHAAKSSPAQYLSDADMRWDVCLKRNRLHWRFHLEWLTFGRKHTWHWVNGWGYILEECFCCTRDITTWLYSLVAPFLIENGCWVDASVNSERNVKVKKRNKKSGILTLKINVMKNIKGIHTTNFCAAIHRWCCAMPSIIYYMFAPSMLVRMLSTTTWKIHSFALV